MPQVATSMSSGGSWHRGGVRSRPRGSARLRRVCRVQLADTSKFS